MFHKKKKKSFLMKDETISTILREHLHDGINEIVIAKVLSQYMLVPCKACSAAIM